MAVVTRKRQHRTTYYVVTEWRGKKHWERSGSDKREARRLSDRRKREVAEGSFRPRAASETVTVGTYAETWLEGRRCRWAADEAAYMRRHVLSREWFAGMRLLDVKPQHGDRLIDELEATISERTKRPLGPKTVSTIYGICSTMFKAAVRAGLIVANPFQAEHGRLHRRSVARRQPYTVEDIRRVLTCEKANPTARVFAAIVLLTGMREGEALGRRWRDWTPAEPLSCLTVDSQYDGQLLKSDEHAAGEHARKVPVHPDLVRVLTWWRTEGFRLMHRREPVPDDFIVPDASGKCFGRSAAYSMWRRALDKAGVTNLSLHSTRHTFITLCRRGGARADVLERVTHNARGAIIDEYTHWDWAPLCEAVLCLGASSASLPGAGGGSTGDAVGDAARNGSRLLVAPPGFEPGTPNGTYGNDSGVTGEPANVDPTHSSGNTTILALGPAARHRPRPYVVAFRALSWLQLRRAS